MAKIVDHPLFAWYAGIKGRRFDRSKMRWFEPMCENSHCHCEQWFVFSCLFFEFLQRKCGAPLRVDRATLFKWNTTGYHLLRSTFSTNNFLWIWFVFEGPHGGLLFCFGLIPWFASCDYLINVYWSIAIVFFQHLYICTNRQEPFLSNCGFLRENKSFSRPGVHAISNECCWKKCPRLVLSHGMSLMTILHYQFTHSINVLWHNARFSRNFTDFVFERTSDIIELIN